MAIVSWTIMVKTDKNFVIAETHPTRTPRFLRLQKKCVIMYLILLLSDLRFIGSVNQSSRIETKTALTLEYFRYSEGKLLRIIPFQMIIIWFAAVPNKNNNNGSNNNNNNNNNKEDDDNNNETASHHRDHE